MSVVSLLALLAGLLAPRPGAPAQVGLELPEQAIEGPERLGRFFSGLAALEAGAPRRVRITHFGDSHVAADLWTGVLRLGLQARFGDGGRGFVLAGRAWASYWQAHVAVDSVGSWRVDGQRGGLDDDWTGPGGCSLAADDPSAFVTIATPARPATARGFELLEVHYLRQPAAGCFEVLVDGTPVARIDARGPWLAPAAAEFDVAPGPHRVVLRPLAGGEARLLGVSMENRHGLVYDALGLNGAHARRLLRQEPEAFGAVVSRLAPDLVLLSYGANELFDPSLTPERYRAEMDLVLTRVRAAAPGADCLVTAPFDMLYERAIPPMAEAVATLQRTLAAAHGCAFWDARAAMGGPGSIRAWRRAGLAQADHVHLTKAGYMQLGEALLQSLHAARALLSAQHRVAR